MLAAGVKREDTFSATLLNRALNIVLEGTVEKGNITYNSKQISAYSDCQELYRSRSSIMGLGPWKLEAENVIHNQLKET
jgi:hypothetical protein